MDRGKSTEVRVNRRRFLQIVAVAGTGAACWKLGLFGTGKSLQVARRSLPIMGTVMNLAVYGPDRDACEEALNTTIATMQDLESRLSRHMPESELATLNRTGTLLNGSSHLLSVLTTAQDLSRKSAGAFDVTVLPILRLHEKLQPQHQLPDDRQRSLARGLVGYEKIRIDGSAIHLAVPGMAVSLDGIGKGYIIDQGVAALRTAGFNNVLVEAGGDLMVSGLKENRTPWLIGIRNPRTGSQKNLVTTAVSNKAVATSGDYMQSFSPDLQHHHIIDPLSGFSPSELASCTVTAPNVTLADGLATAAMVLGKDKAMDLIEPMSGCEAYMVGKDLKQYNTTGFLS